jgi:hypothetical protein
MKDRPSNLQWASLVARTRPFHLNYCKFVRTSTTEGINAAAIRFARDERVGERHSDNAGVTGGRCPRMFTSPGVEMANKITVFHPSISGDSDRTDFEGDGVEYRMEEGGALRIMHWTTGTKIGDTLFAPGHWHYVSRSEQPNTKGGEATEQIIKDGIARFIG